MPDPMPLTDLTDHDVMLNLYMSVVMAIHVTDADPTTVEMSICRMTDGDDTIEQTATLKDLMTEVERRLKFNTPDVADISVSEPGWLQ